MRTVNLQPKFGKNYKVGYAFFTYTSGSFISTGIAFFERWNRMSDIRVSHTGIVTGNNECIEAQPSGVVRSDMSHHFDNPKVKVFFRKPRYYNNAMGIRIAQSAAECLGQKYDYSLIVGRAIAGTTFGAILSKLTGGWFDRAISRLTDNKEMKICSEVTGYALRAQPELAKLGCLKKHDRVLDPQIIFEDDAIFEPWKKEKQ